MNDTDLLAVINATEQKLTLWASIHGSDGYTHWLELLYRLKAGPFIQEAFCKLFSVAPGDLPSMLTTVDSLLLLGDQVAQDSPRDVALLDKIKTHDLILKLVAKLLG